jgi:hypothetical protein
MNKKRKLAASRSVGAPERCRVCVPALVDRAIARSGVAVEQHDRFRLIAALLGRQHLILSGSDTILLNALARALADELAEEREEYVCRFPGHPWWAAGTERVGYYAQMNESVAMWRLCYFLADALPETASEDYGRQRVVCVQSMSMAEVGYYYEFLARQLASVPELAQSQVALVGAYVGVAPLSLSPVAERLTSVVHLGAEIARAE